MTTIPIYEHVSNHAPGGIAPMLTYCSEGILPRVLIGSIEAPDGTTATGGGLSVPLPKTAYGRVYAKRWLTLIEAMKAARGNMHGLAFRPAAEEVGGG